MGVRTHLRTEAIVLRRKDHGESDWIVTLFTRDFGKIKGIAKGARRSRRRFANTLDDFCCLNLIFSQRGRGSLVFLESSDIVEHFGEIRLCVEKTALASYLVELLDAFTPEGKPNRELYETLRGFLILLNAGAPMGNLARFYEIRLLAACGYDPALDRCARCGTTMASAPSLVFHAAEGGVLCPACLPAGPPGLPLSQGAAKTLLLAKRLPIPRLVSLSLTPQTARETEEILGVFVNHLLGRELLSLQVLRQIRQFSIDTSRKNK